MEIESQQRVETNSKRAQFGIENKSKMMLVLRWMTLGSGAVLMLNGVLRYIFFSSMASQAWQIFQPAYLIIFGFIILGAELHMEQVLNKVVFMNSYGGKAILDIFVATIVSSLMGSGLSVFTVLLTISLCTIGIMNAFLHCSQTSSVANTAAETVSTNRSSLDQDSSFQMAKPLSDNDTASQNL